MRSILIEEYHYMILDLMQTDSSFKWNTILKEEDFDYSRALERVKEMLLDLITSYDELMVNSDGAELELFISNLKWAESISERNWDKV